MKRFFVTTCCIALAGVSLAENPPQKIDLGAVPAKVVDDVVVPVPSEVFLVLDKLGSPNWHEQLRTATAKPQGARAQVALVLGTVIAEGFIAVEAQESEEVKKIGRSVLNLAGAIGVRKSVTARSNAIIEAADKKDWNKVRTELDGALQDVKGAMMELRDGDLAQLVSLGGWLRGTEALTSIVRRNFTKDGADLLNQPVLLDHFQRSIVTMGPQLRGNGLVKQIEARLPDIKPLITPADGEISSKSVEGVHLIMAELVKAIGSKEKS
jgi:hypothetical protein